MLSGLSAFFCPMRIMDDDSKKLKARRRTVQLALWPVVVIVIAFGWHYPLLGFSVPVVMLMGAAGGVLRGRYVCGHLCPGEVFLTGLFHG